MQRAAAQTLILFGPVFNEGLPGLRVAVNDMANRSIETLNKLTEAIKAATEQAGRSSAEATAVATQSTNLSGG